MKPILQTKFGKGGNCLQAATASLLELSLDEVPNFAEYYTDDENDQSWVDDIWLPFLARYDLWSLELDATQGDGVRWRPRGYHFINGPSPRGPFDHVIIGYNGEPVHDPYPDGNCELLKHDTWTVFISMVEKL